MATYGTGWRGVCLVLGAVGMAAAVSFLPVEVLVVLGLLILSGGLTAAVGYEPGDVEPPRYTRGRTVLIAMTGCAAVAAVAGLGAFLGLIVLWPVLLLGAASPPAMRWYARRLGFSRAPSEGH